MLVLAIIGAGGIFTGSNPSYTPAELAHHIKASQSKFLFSEPEIFDSLLQAGRSAGISEQNTWVFDNLGQSIPAGRRSWNELLHHGEEDWVRFNDLKTASETTAARLFSSGTTGLPKATTITHYNLIAQHEAVVGAHPPPYDVSCGFRAFALHYGHRQNVYLLTQFIMAIRFHESLQCLSSMRLRHQSPTYRRSSRAPRLT